MKVMAQTVAFERRLIVIGIHFSGLYKKSRSSSGRKSPDLPRPQGSERLQKFRQLHVIKTNQREYSSFFTFFHPDPIGGQCSWEPEFFLLVVTPYIHFPGIKIDSAIILVC